MESDSIKDEESEYFWTGENEDYLKEENNYNYGSNEEEQKTNQEVENYTEEECDYLFKIIIVGESSVGKTSLLMQYYHHCFQEKRMSTLGLDLIFKTLKVGDHIIGVQLWDSAGQERFRATSRLTFSGSDAVIYVYDITQHSSFMEIQNWMKETDQYCIDNLYLMIGNKIDLEEERQVNTEEAKEFAKEHKMNFFEVSAKTAINVKKSFEDIIHNLYFEAKKNNKLPRKKDSNDSVQTLRITDPIKNVICDNKDKEKNNGTCC
ncbi:small gtp binding protein rab8 [Anaeramoeba flamelloides]|uniref:Small gtp binding protein rab8 n=1 Tax=Anaeramoeba flamelloides TaxID=1746091 RepID=A0ABQ8Z8U7_9EUKA|nr:small gtp binding protein rab8 [Anaeramoeba flamelloides]